MPPPYDNNDHSYIALCPKMSSRRCTIPKIPRYNLCKNAKKQLKKNHTINNQSKQQRSTDKDTASILKHSKPLTLKKKKKRKKKEEKKKRE